MLHKNRNSFYSCVFVMSKTVRVKSSQFLSRRHSAALHTSCWRLWLQGYIKPSLCLLHLSSSSSSGASRTRCQGWITMKSALRSALSDETLSEPEASSHAAAASQQKWFTHRFTSNLTANTGENRSLRWDNKNWSQSCGQLERGLTWLHTLTLIIYIWMHHNYIIIIKIQFSFLDSWPRI